MIFVLLVYTTYNFTDNRQVTLSAKILGGDCNKKIYQDIPLFQILCEFDNDNIRVIPEKIAPKFKI